MKQAWKIIGASLAGVLAVLVIGALMLYALMWLAFTPKPTVVQELPSPDGKYVAYVYESNSGATSGFVYHLSILRKDEKLGRGVGNTFVQEDTPFAVVWVSDRILRVENGSTLHRQRSHVKGVEVQYRYPGEETTLQKWKGEGSILELILCIVAVFIGIVHLVVSHFWQKKWFAFLPIASYLCLVPFVMNTFHDVARRAETGDIGGLLDIYPGIGNGFLMLVGAVTVLHVIALLMRGKGNLHG